MILHRKGYYENIDKILSTNPQFRCAYQHIATIGCWLIL